MSSYCKITLNQFVLESSEVWMVSISSEYVNVLLRQLEISSFKLGIFAWCPIINKSKINVDQMADIIN